MKNLNITIERQKFIVNGELKNDTICINFPLEKYKLVGMLYSYNGVYELTIQTKQLELIITDLMKAYFELQKQVKD